MNRRNFLLAAAGASTATWSASCLANIAPCPPKILSVAGGGSAAGICGSNSAADWTARTSGPGVRWFHSFDSDDEITKYTPPSFLPQVSRVAAGGVDGGGYLQCRPRDNGDGTFTYNDNAWRRPFTPDPHAVGGYSPGGPWAKGMYAHPDYIRDGEFPGAYDGSEFYLQVACLVPGARAAADFGGKILWITAWPGFTPSREFVIGSGRDSSKLWRNGKLQAYTNFSASGWQLKLPDPSKSGNSFEQPNGEWDHVYGTAESAAKSCNYVGGGECWTWPWATGVDQWVTFLIHMVPGRDAAGIATNVYQDGAARDTLFEIFVAENGHYRKVIGGLWNTVQDTKDFPKGWNGFQASCYYNAVTSPVYFWQGFDQMIFSSEWIPPPSWTGAG